jgi:hypothetical protein
LKGLQEHPVVTAFGATTIIVLTLLAPLVSPLHHELYHFYGPASVLILPVLLNFAGVWIVLSLLLAGGLRFRWLNIGLWCILAVFLPWMLMQDCFSLARGSMCRRGAMHSGEDAIWNIESPVLQMMPWHSSPHESIFFHQLDYRELPAAGDKLLEDRSATFVLLHMPIPQMPGIYDTFLRRLKRLDKRARQS